MMRKKLELVILILVEECLYLVELFWIEHLMMKEVEGHFEILEVVGLQY